MDKYKYDETGGLRYEMTGGYYLLCLTLPESKDKPLGLWDSGTSAICRRIGKSSTPGC